MVDDGAKSAGDRLRGLSAVGGILPQVAGAVLGLSALGYVAGWREADAYYSAIGAPWFARQLPPAQLLLESASFIGGIAFFAVLTLVSVANGAWSLESVSRWARWLTFTGVGGYAIALILDQWILAGWISLTLAFSTAMWSIAVGLFAGELVGSFRRDQTTWEIRQLMLSWAVVSLGLWYGPMALAGNRARVDMKISESSLPHLIGPGVDSTWHVVTVTGDRALAVHLDTLAKARLFRIVNLTDSMMIRSTELAR
jgi:hypothetical protein